MRPGRTTTTAEPCVRRWIVASGPERDGDPLREGEPRRGRHPGGSDGPCAHRGRRTAAPERVCPAGEPPDWSGVPASRPAVRRCIAGERNSARQKRSTNCESSHSRNRPHPVAVGGRPVELAGHREHARAPPRPGRPACRTARRSCRRRADGGWRSGRSTESTAPNAPSPMPYPARVPVSTNSAPTTETIRPRVASRLARGFGPRVTGGSGVRRRPGVAVDRAGVATRAVVSGRRGCCRGRRPARRSAPGRGDGGPGPVSTRCRRCGARVRRAGRTAPARARGAGRPFSGSGATGGGAPGGRRRSRRRGSGTAARSSAPPLGLAGWPRRSRRRCGRVALAVARSVTTAAADVRRRPGPVTDRRRHAPSTRRRRSRPASCRPDRGTAKECSPLTPPDRCVAADGRAVAPTR